MSDHDWVEVFTQEFEQPESAVLARSWADVLGDEYPAELAPYSYTTRSELQFVADALAVGSGDVLVDIGCGRGGPGLWVAATTGARYVGVDIAASALDAVARRAERLGLSTRVRTIEGSFDSLPLDDGEADTVMSIDALLFAPDKPAATAEMARVVRPADASSRPRGTTTLSPLGDRRRSLTIGHCWPTSAWTSRSTTRPASGISASGDRRTTLGQRRRTGRESGENRPVLQGIVEMAATQASMSRRVLFVAVLTLPR